MIPHSSCKNNIHILGVSVDRSAIMNLHHMHILEGKGDGDCLLNAKSSLVTNFNSDLDQCATACVLGISHRLREYVER